MALENGLAVNITIPGGQRVPRWTNPEIENVAY